MATLTLNTGGSSITVACQKAGKAEPILVGETSRSFSGIERTSVRAQKYQVAVVLVPVIAATAASIEALFANGAQVPCNGDVFNNTNATVTCSAKVTSEMEQGGTYWTVSLSLSQVS
jgi:hypothetical protein